MSALYSATLSAFKAQSWIYREISGMEVIEADFEAHHTKVPLHVQVYGEPNIASVVAESRLSSTTRMRRGLASAGEVTSCE